MIYQRATSPREKWHRRGRPGFCGLRWSRPPECKSMCCSKYHGQREITLAFRESESKIEWWHSSYRAHKARGSYSTFPFSQGPPRGLLLISNICYSFLWNLLPTMLTQDWPHDFLNGSWSRASDSLHCLYYGAVLPKIGLDLESFFQK